MLINYNAYSNMLTEQVEMCFPFENAFFQKIALNKMANVYEIGCGNGSFLKKLSDFYSNPSYKGYDLCQPLITIAKTKENLRVNFEIGSIDSLNTDCDLTILRLIVHQLQDRYSFFKTLASKLRKNQN